MESKKVAFFNKLSLVCLLATIFGSFLFFIPYVPVTLEASKGFLISVGVTLSLFFWLIARLGEGKFSIPKDRLLIFAGAIPFVFLIASFFSSSKYISLFGSGFEIGTFGSMLILFILFFLSSLYFQTEKRLWYFYGMFFVVATLLAVFELFNMFIGVGRFTPGLLKGISSGNLIGSWNDFALFFGLVVLLCIFILEFLKTKGLFKVVQYFLLVTGLFFLIIINMPLVWLLVGLMSILIFVYSISMNAGKKAVKGATEKKKFPTIALITIFISLVFLVGNNSIGILVSKYVNLSNPDIRPSFTTTTQIAYQAFKHNPAFGTGPNTFVIDWVKWMPKQIANTPFWNTDFGAGASLLLTFLVTTGVLGFVAWILFFIIFALRGIQSFRIALENTLSNYFITSTFMIALYSWISMIIYVPNILMLTLGFVSSGMLIGILVFKGKIKTVEWSFLSDPRNSFFSILGIMVLMIAAISTTYIYSEKFASIIYFSKSLNPTNTMESLGKSESNLMSALNLDKNDIYYRSLSQVYVAEIGLVINDKSLSEDILKSEVQQLVNRVEESAGGAVAQNPNQYLNWVNLGNVYTALVPLSVSGSYKNASDAYTHAMTLAPSNPSILLAQAELELANKNNEQAKKLIEQALYIKADYTDAIFLLAQIETSEGNLDGAIAQAERASQVSPNDSTVFFRLGLLRYNKPNYTGSISAFETAVILDPSYLNARYFLGLSYQKVGRTNDALTQFKIISSVVPDNQDIKDAITSLSQTAPKTSAPAVKTPIKNTKLPLSGKR